MSPAEIAVRGVSGLVLVALNAFFVVSEFSLTRLRSLGRDEIEGHPGLERAWEMTERLEIYLTGCQLGITTTSILLGVVAEPAVTHLIRPPLEGLGAPERSLPVLSVVLAVVVIQMIHKVWGEQVPTYLGVERPRVAGVTGPVLYWWVKATYPLIMAGDGLAKATLRAFGVEMRRSWTEEIEAEDERERPATVGELMRQMGEVLSRGGVAPDRREEVLAALEIETIPTREVMVPRSEIVSLRVGRPFEESWRTMGENPNVRFPLVGESMDDFRGLVYLPTVVAHWEELERGETDLEEIAAEPLRVEAETPVAELIDIFQAERQEIALVEEAGEIVGLVTATDAFEAIAGELEDPQDSESE